MDDLQRWLEEHVAGRDAVVLGVGNRLRGDDGAGPAVVDRLRARGHAGAIDAGTVPENFLGPLEAAAPEVVLFVDALAHGAPPGTRALIDPAQLAARDGGTHAPTLRLLAGWLAARGASCWLLGIQPGGSGCSEPLSPPVERAVEAVALALDGALAAAVGPADAWEVRT